MPVAFTMHYKPYFSGTANSLNNGSSEQMPPKLNLETEYLFTSDKAKASIFIKDDWALCKGLFAFINVNSGQNSV